MNEIYKDIPNYPGYKASNLGNIKSYLSDKDGKILSPRRDKDGYLMVWTKNNSAARVHRLVLLAFDHENYFDGAVVNHINGIKDDNRVENLEWTTISYNTKHAYETGLAISAASHPIGVYYKNRMISCFYSINQLSEHCGINSSSVSEAIRKKGKIFDELSLVELTEVNTNVLNNPFCFVKMNRYQSSPFIYNSEFFESIKDLSESYGFSRGQINWARKKNLPLNNINLKEISRFHYISQGHFND